MTYKDFRAYKFAASRRYWLHMLETYGSVRATAKVARVNRTTVYKNLQLHGIDTPQVVSKALRNAGLLPTAASVFNSMKVHH